MRHFLDHEELAHVRSFGSNRFFRRVSLDGGLWFGLTRQKTDEQIADIVNAAIVKMDSELARIATELNIRSRVEVEVVHAFRLLLQLQREYHTEAKTRKADGPAGILATIFSRKTLTLARLAMALSTIRRYLRDDTDAVGMERWRIDLHGFVVDALSDIQAAGSLAYHAWRIITNNHNDASNDKITQALAFIVTPVPGSGKDMSWLENTLLHVVGSNRARAFIGDKLMEVGGGITQLARILASVFLKHVAATYAVDTARSLLVNFFRPLLSRNAIVSGAAVPQSDAIGSFKLSVTDMKAFILHLTATSKEMLRPRKSFLSRKKKAIERASPTLISGLEGLLKEDSTMEGETRSMVTDFVSTRKLRGLVSAADIRSAAYANPTHLARWFADADRVTGESPVISMLLDQRVMRLGAGAQGYVYGFQALPKDDASDAAYVAVKFTNPWQTWMRCGPWR